MLESGDAAFCILDSADDAAQRPIKLLQRTAIENTSRGRQHQLQLRIGMHWGSVLSDGVSVSGDAVNLCSRVAASAAPGEIRLTRQVFLQLGRTPRDMCRILASVAIPGALPPVIIDGDLLCDGGTFNNFPVDVMRRRWGVGRVIGVDLAFNQPRRIEHAEVPGTWALRMDRFRPRAKRRYKLPSLPAFLMNVTVLYSTSRTREVRRLTDLYFNPPLGRVGMLQWHRFDEIVARGYAHACQVLGETPAQPPAA